MSNPIVGDQGGCFKNAWELLNLRGLKISMLCKNHIFQGMGKIFCVEFQRAPLKFHTKYLTHTLKDVDCECFWNAPQCLCPACRTTLIATRFWVVMICRIIKCLTVLEFSFILFDLCLFITIFNFILNYVPIVTFWIFTYYKIWILLIIFCFIWSYWIIYFLTCLEVFWSVVS